MKVSFLGKSRLTTQGQTTLPMEGRSGLGVEVGSEVYWYSVDGFLIVTKDLCSHEDLSRLLKKSARSP
ncbi:AbrB/MazE/SpoVT family DNA-binding domain-containing protein [Candidatus Woesearchaeota archaeon]|nr:AbrB/MazE/SpoVT family DNA-binding domain-containing protein [Candidatus Woesearchaeota archaeon]